MKPCSLVQQRIMGHISLLLASNADAVRFSLLKQELRITVLLNKKINEWITREQHQRKWPFPPYLSVRCLRFDKFVPFSRSPRNGCRGRYSKKSQKSILNELLNADEALEGLVKIHPGLKLELVTIYGKRPAVPPPNHTALGPQGYE